MSGLHTEVVGPGRPSFGFLHGLFGRGRNWAGIATTLAEQGHGSVLFDLPNHGRSRWTGTFSYAAMADEVAEEIELRLGSAAAMILVGHSLGGKVAMLTALNHPRLVSALAVIDIAPGTSGQVGTFGPLVAAMGSLDLTTLGSRQEADRRLSVSVPDDAARLFLLQNLRRRPHWHWQPNLELLGSSLAEVAGWPEVGDARYPGPVIWLTGERSEYVTDADVPVMMTLFPRTRRVVVPGAGHWVHTDNPDAVVSALLELAEERERALSPRRRR